MILSLKKFFAEIAPQLGVKVPAMKFHVLLLTIAGLVQASESTVLEFWSNVLGLRPVVATAATESTPSAVSGSTAKADSAVDLTFDSHVIPDFDSRVEDCAPLVDADFDFYSSLAELIE